MSASPLVDRWIVLKFGGTSVSRRHRWDTIGKLAKKRAEETGSRVLVVVSALSGVTNELTAIADGAPDSRDRVAALVERHEGFLAELGLGREVLAERLAALQGLLDDQRAATRPLQWQAEVLGQGELLSSTLGAAYLHASGLDMGWMDARQWLDAMPPQPNQSDWSQRLSVNCQWRADAEWMQRFRAQPTRLLITQGFISRHADGGTAILGRGGSDTSAAYFGALLGASRVEIWTDVPGMFSANPKDVPDARLLTRLGGEEVTRAEVEGDPVGAVRRLGSLTGATVLLKGSTTVVAAPAGVVHVQSGAPAWLATAGAGDVLAGVVGTLLAAGLAPDLAGALGALVHGEAAHDANPGGPVRASKVAQEIGRTVARLLAASAG